MARRSEGYRQMGTEGLALFEGAALRDKALAQSAEGRQEAIQRVRGWLVREFRANEFGPDDIPSDLTADDVHDALDALGLGEGDTRWSANILRGWERVVPTDRFVPCRRKSRHSAPTRVWRWA